MTQSAAISIFNDSSARAVPARLKAIGVDLATARTYPVPADSSQERRFGSAP
jgi:hypothetical protein